MIELETAVFLQNQKTGSTFVEHFLRENCGEKIIVHKQHKSPGLLRKGRFHFITVRDPLDLYLSLFNYGMDGAGRIRMRLTQLGQGHLYDAGIEKFEPWLAYVLSDDFKTVLPKYEPHYDEMGLCTWRYLQLATMNFRHKQSKMDHVLRFEALNDELKELVRGPLAPAMRDVNGACDWIDGRRQINASNRRDRNSRIELSRGTLKRLLKREAYLYDAFYADRRKAIASAVRWPRFGKQITVADLTD